MTPHDSLDFLHLLMVPVVATIGWLMKQIAGKASKDDMLRAVDELKASMADLTEERRSMHRENQIELRSIHQTLLDMVGGKYDRSHKRD